MANKRTRRTAKKWHMKGGAFNQDQLSQLDFIGFSQSQIETLSNLNISFDDIITKINTTESNGQTNFTEQITNELVADHNNNSNLNTSSTVSLNDYSSDMDSLHLSDLDTSRMSEYTTNSDTSNGGRRYINRSRRVNTGKTKKIKRRYRKYTRKYQKGGMCYGRGVGANSYDPNYSIYNTRELALFPYLPK